MKTFRNTTADLDAECTVIIFAESEQAPTSNGSWVECAKEELKSFSGISQLFMQAGVRYYGFV